MENLFKGGITLAGRAALQGVSQLQLGNVKIGSASLANAVIDDSATDISGDLEASLDVTNVFYTPFGSDRLVIFTELEMTSGMSIGNIMFFTSNSTPLAWGAFDRTVKKTAKGPDTGGDWIVLALNMRFTGILEKFDLNPSYSTEFEITTELTEALVVSEHTGPKKVSVMADAVVPNFNIPGLLFQKPPFWAINPLFFQLGDDFDAISGGSVNDAYDRNFTG